VGERPLELEAFDVDGRVAGVFGVFDLAEDDERIGEDGDDDEDGDASPEDFNNGGAVELRWKLVAPAAVAEDGEEDEAFDDDEDDHGHDEDEHVERVHVMRFFGDTACLARLCGGDTDTEKRQEGHRNEDDGAAEGPPYPGKTHSSAPSRPAPVRHRRMFPPTVFTRL